MARRCPVCENEKDLIPLWGLVHIVRCPRCSLAYVDELPGIEALTEMYSGHYFKGDWGGYEDYVAERAAQEANFRRRIAVLRRFSDGGDLFEAGCAHGFFLQMAAQYWRVEGIDISHEAIAYAREVVGVAAAQGDFESHPPAPDSFDVIAMWDTIEHLYGPVLAVQKSAEALRAGGILALTTADLDALLPRLRKSAWRMIHPAHLYYFSRRSMARLLDRYGLDVVYFAHEAVYRSLGEIAKVLVWGSSVAAWRRALYRHLTRLPFMGIRVPLNLYDIMFVIARKRG